MVPFIEDRLYRVAFVTGLALLGLAAAFGFVYAFRDLQSMPPLAAYAVGTGSAEDLIDQQDYDTAIRELRLMLRLAPAGAERTHNLLGRALEARGDYAEAAEQFRSAIALHPEFAEAHNNLGVALARQGRLDEAVAEVREALRLDPELPEALQNFPRMQAKLAAAAGTASMEGGGGGETAPAAAAAETEQELPPEIERGREYVRQFYRGELEDLHGRFTPAFAQQVSLEAFTEMRRTAGIQLGPELTVLDERLGTVGESTLYVRKARFERFDGEVEVVIQLDPEGAVMGFLLRPAE